ncbi:uncharacterized protein LOC116386358 isoform X1 [Anarrhichthys ocellatus]|uniref:uncharacterized protein LOC116386358 isoform X1 n=1 Tax=Anarrhichthys ocellatus TaxID=433405 RepID=UPI0012ED749E|nr:uncharacterized protein LOC116386358 isoform X1 [Anarrhichthys ocellatus]
MAHLYLQGLQLLVLLIVKSECRDILPKTVFASKEEDIVLPCFENYRTTSCYRVKLIKYATDASQMKVILARPKIPKLKDAERVKWDADRNVSLFLTKTQLSDEGLYGCEIWQGWDCIHVKNISIKVRDCKTLQAVKASPGSPVNLNCPVNVTSGQQGPQNISWAMLKGGNPKSLDSERVEMNGMSLAIQSVHDSDSGWYTCKHVLGQTQRCFEIYLRVRVENVTVATVPGLTTSEIILETKMEGSSRAFIAVLVASVIVGIAIMAALIGLFIYRRRNTRRVTQQTQRHTPGTLSDVYEIVDLTPSEDHTNNCLYQQSLDEGLCTFRYQ